MTANWKTRGLEILPGALVWTTLILSVVLSFIRPLWVVYFVIVFDLYWLFRVTYFIPFMFVSWFRYHRNTRKDWQVLAERQAAYEDVRHLVFLPTYKEEIGVIRGTIGSILSSAFPAKKMILVLAGEERDSERFLRNAEIIKQEYGDRFLLLTSTLHPQNLPDEIPGKGSNLNYSGHAVLPIIDELGLDYDKVVVSSFDVDTVVHPQYFSCLTYLFLTVSEPTKTSYQPIALYNNNLWESPAAVRVAMFGTTFWLLSELSRPEGAMTFSSHSMSLRMLVDVGFWQKDIVSEDSRIFLQALIKYHGNYRVTPMYIPVSMDTVMTGGYWQALAALYKQIRRWAWGVENFPFMVRAFAADKQMPFMTKFGFVWKQLEGMYTWATAPMLIFLLGRLPFWVAPEQFREFAIFQNTPFTLQWLMRFAMVGVFVSAAMSLTLLPRRPSNIPVHRAVFVGVLQWVLLPVTFVLFGAFPAIDAQTRMMLGRRLGFNVSPKRKTIEDGI
ncbi:glycosyltransferase family 2 protein [Patescibacteria group bacterium]|nr:glycosyltransferase family 2 protein [Patescibacteria group bacterium]MBU1034274.1 glycosyltransferase family 2 protein [Patescibacteria group bacterium]MBU1629914.1 glycosyltransferase family 2 protein [Patescibacteria group bacterium]MBU1908354.1 glycosyltransferase family 2 protein [Patescibacteria group bacterium]